MVSCLKNQKYSILTGMAKQRYSPSPDGTVKLGVPKIYFFLTVKKRPKKLFLQCRKNNFWKPT
jgi:hypothetical protein